MRSRALPTGCSGGGGVRKRRSAHAPARSGKSSRVAANRTFVLICGKGSVAGMAGPRSGNGVTLEKGIERGERALAGFLVAEETPVVMHHERDAEHLEGDLLGIGLLDELAFLHRLAHGTLQRVDPGALAAGE